MRLLDFVLRIAVSGDVFPRALAEAVEAALVLGLALHCEPRVANQDDVAGAALDHLKFDGVRPDLVLAIHVKQHAAVACLVLARLVRLLSPLEHHVQVVVSVFLFRDEVAKLRSGNVYRAVFHAEDVIRIIVLPLLLEERVEPIEILSVEQFDFRAELRIGRGQRR